MYVCIIFNARPIINGHPFESFNRKAATSFRLQITSAHSQSRLNFTISNNIILLAFLNIFHFYFSRGYKHQGKHFIKGFNFDENILCWCFACAARAVAFRLFAPLQRSGTILILVGGSTHMTLKD